MGIREKIKGILVRRQETIYKARLAAKKVNYHTWVETKESKAGVPTEEEVVDVLRQQTEKSGGETLIWCRKAGKLNKQAHSWIEAYFEEHPQVMIVYGDEDVWTDGKEREKPWYKPEWSPDTYKSCFYVGSVIALRKTFAEKLCEQGILVIPKQESKQEALKSAGQGEYIFDKPEEISGWLDKAIEAAGGFAKGCDSIGRIPQILYHVADEAVWDEYLENDTWLRNPEEEPAVNEPEGIFTNRKVSVIIPSKDNPALLKQCLDSLQKSFAGRKNIPELEIVVVDNGSLPENRKRLEALLKEHTYLYQPMEFNFAKMCNMGAKKATGSVYLFLNDDIEFCENNCFLAMLESAVQPYVGAVGLKLYYPDSQKIQHAGITNLAVGPVHKLQGFEDTERYYFGKNDMVQNYLAVTGACLMIEKDKFDEVGGFEESLQVAYNDVDLCMKLYEAGYQNVSINTCFAYHHESFTRGSDETGLKQKRRQEELHILEERHPALTGVDPYYPKQLEQESLDAGILPGYLWANTIKQKASWQPWSDKLRDAWEDKCVLIGIENCHAAYLQGYSVVLGDNNACYDKYLVVEGTDGKRFYAPVMGQYRPDLENNLPDQRNVALGGFCVLHPLEGLEKDEYRVGIMAVHRISRLKLLNWSNKMIDWREV